jgi:hypothetical protein
VLGDGRQRKSCCTCRTQMDAVLWPRPGPATVSRFSTWGRIATARWIESLGWIQSSGPISERRYGRGPLGQRQLTSSSWFWQDPWPGAGRRE